MKEPLSTKNFIKAFDDIARHKHRYDVFRDFITMSAISLHNAINKSENLEKEYMEIVAHYSKDEVIAISHLFAELVLLLELEPKDVLGALYMQLELGNNKVGQFFTPPHISELMAELAYGDKLKDMKKPFITLSEPACGAGGMVLAFTKVLVEAGHNPMYRMWVQCIDIDRLAALMCYVQLSLWNIPAEVVVGNALTLDVREVFYTPAHYMGAWDMRLKVRYEAEKLLIESQDEKSKEPQKKSKIKPVFLKKADSENQEKVQILFDF